MSWLKLLDGLTELAVYFKRAYQKSEKERYEDERKKDSSTPANTFERDFGAGGLCSESKLPGDKADIGKG